MAVGIRGFAAAARSDGLEQYGRVRIEPRLEFNPVPKAGKIAVRSVQRGKP
jgi:hypothetical protein